MIERYNILNTKISNMLSSGGGSNDSLNQFDIIASIPNTLSGQLLTYIAQNERPNRKLNGLIAVQCLKHYKRVKGRKHWTRKSKSLPDCDIRRMTEIAINSIVDFKHVTVRELSNKLCEPTMSCHRNHDPVYNEILLFILSALSQSVSKSLEKLKKT